MGKRKVRLVAVIGAVGVSLLVGIPPASAACHAFSIGLSQSTVQEGGSLTVTVSRDGAAADSSVRVSTVDGSAKAGSDFGALNQQAAFTGSETQKTFTVAITDDSTPEGAETFSIHLSDPAGCAPNPNYSLDSDKTVTIAANDEPVAQTMQPAPTTPPTTRPAATTPRTTPATTPRTTPATTVVVTTSAAPETTTTLVEEATTSPDNDSGGGFPTGAAIGIVVALIVAAGAAVALRRRRGV